MSGALSSVLLETPKYYFGVGWWFALCAFVLLNRQRFTRAATLALLAVSSVPVIGLSVLLSPARGGVMVLSYTLTMGVQLLLLMFFCGMPWENGLYYAIRSAMVAELSASFDWQVFYFGVNSGVIGRRLLWEGAVHLVCYGIAALLIFAAERGFRRDNEELVISKPQILTAAIVFLLAYTLANISYVTDATPFGVSSSMDLFVIRTVAFLGGAGVLYMYHAQLVETERRLNAEKLNAVAAMQYNNYLMAENSIRLVNEKYHDLRHQIRYLKSEIASEEKVAALEKMEQEIRSFEGNVRTGNRVLDAILGNAIRSGAEKGVRIVAMADGQVLNFMTGGDIATLMGNAIENAVEAASKVEEESERLVHLDVARQNNFVRIHLKNRYPGGLELQDGLPRTTKQDRNYHGFGVRSMENTVKKYNGSMTIDASGTWYELKILIP